jgi:hypothetical protein
MHQNFPPLTRRSACCPQISHTGSMHSSWIERLFPLCSAPVAAVPAAVARRAPHSPQARVRITLDAPGTATESTESTERDTLALVPY